MRNRHLFLHRLAFALVVGVHEKVLAASYLGLEDLLLCLGREAVDAVVCSSGSAECVISVPLFMRL